MKAISIHQPWPHAILHLGKRVENRSKATLHRGPLLVHAAKSLKSYAAQVAADWPRLYGVELPARDESLVFGAIVGVVELTDCVRVGPGGSLGLYESSAWAVPGMYAWVLDRPRAFATPIPYSGCQNFFDVPDELVPEEYRT